MLRQSNAFQMLTACSSTSSHPSRCQEVSLCGLMAFRTIEIRRGHGKNNFPHLPFLLFLFLLLSSSYCRILIHPLIFFLYLNLRYYFLSIFCYFSYSFPFFNLLLSFHLFLLRLIYSPLSLFSFLVSLSFLLLDLDPCLYKMYRTYLRARSRCSQTHKATRKLLCYLWVNKFLAGSPQVYPEQEHQDEEAQEEENDEVQEEEEKQME